MLPGYIFVRPALGQLMVVRELPNLLSPLCLDGQAFPLPAGAVEKLIERQEAFEFDDTKEGRAAKGIVASAKFPAGKPVEILEPNPLAFLIGLVDSSDQNGTVRVLIDFFGRKTLVRVKQTELALVA